MQDTRCCGTGTCLMDSHGRCWCGQQWDGEQLCRPGETLVSTESRASIDDASETDDAESERS